ncbi:MAG: YitT family protein [Melioribacteraceae bacterium]|nr:YitT family protein [Melioribacteraceae bacterium]
MKQKLKTPEYRKKTIIIEKPFTKHWFKNISLVILGSILVAFGFVFFIVPFKLVPGGIYGLSIILNSVFGLPIGASSLALNIPLLFLGYRMLGTSFSLKTIISMITASFSIDYLLYLFDGKPLSDDILVSSIFGGVFIGLGIASIFRGEATSGGTDLIARMVSKFTKTPIGQMLIIVDGIIIISGILAFRSIDMVPYAIITIFTLSKTVDTVLTGLDNRKAVFIISDHHEKVRDIILNKLDRGGTYLLGRGLYFHEEDRKIIFTALTRREMVNLQTYIKEVDKEAFITVVDTNEIIGSGFKPLT